MQPLPQESPASNPPVAKADPVASDWKIIPDDEIMMMTLDDGRHITIRLAPRFSPVHVANIRALALAHWWDGKSIYRAKDNYVVQWGDVTEKLPLPDTVNAKPPAEYELSGWDAAQTMTRPDPYAARVGFTAEGWPIGGSELVKGEAGVQWLTHCYGMVGVARNMPPDTGFGSELYAVIGHAPRHLDRNLAVVGRVIEGIEIFSTLPRGSGDIGFYAANEKVVSIRSVRLASDMSARERPAFAYRATDNERFAAHIRKWENLGQGFFVHGAGGADLCNIPLEVKRVK